MTAQFPEEEVVSIEEMRRNVAIQTAMTLLNRSPDPSNIDALLYTADKIETYIANGLDPVEKDETLSNVPDDVLGEGDKAKPLDQK